MDTATTKRAPVTYKLHVLFEGSFGPRAADAQKKFSTFLDNIPAEGAQGQGTGDTEPARETNVLATAQAALQNGLASPMRDSCEEEAEGHEY